VSVYVRVGIHIGRGTVVSGMTSTTGAKKLSAVINFKLCEKGI